MQVARAFRTAVAVALTLPLAACVETTGLEVADRRDSCSLRPIAINETLAGNLSAADCLMDDGSDAHADFYELRIFSTTYVDIYMESTTMDPYLVLLDEDDNVIAEDDDSLGGFDSWIQVKVTPGTYYIAATSYMARETGAYLVTVE
jgi:hypothetical protein